MQNIAEVSGSLKVPFSLYESQYNYETQTRFFKHGAKFVKYKQAKCFSRNPSSCKMTA